MASFRSFSREPAKPACGILLVSGRLASPEAQPAALEDCIFAPLSAALAAEVLEQSRDFYDYPRTHRGALHEFLLRLAGHPDARLREAAAGEAGLSPETLRALSADVSYQVRKALSANEDALMRLSPEACIALAESDGELAENVLSALENCLAQAFGRLLSPEDEGDAAEADEGDAAGAAYETACAHLEAAVAALADHADPGVRTAAAEAKRRLADCGAPEAKAGRRRALRRWRARVSDEASADCAFGRAGDWVCALAFADESGVKPEAKAAFLLLPVDSIDSMLYSLPYTEDFNGIVERLARHPSRTIRAAVAARDCLPKAAVEALKADGTYEVREALLRNNDALAELSPEEIVALIRSDAGLADCTFGRGGSESRPVRILRDAFAGTKDPYMAEVLAELLS